MKNLKTLLILIAAIAATASAQAASHAGAPMAMPDGMKAGAMAASAEMTDGEIRKVDMEAKKITLKHEAIKSMDMPGMTMVFQVKDPAMLTKVKAGDKIKFKVEKAGGAMVVTEIQPAR